MIVRGIDSQNDWLYGKGKNDYKRDRDAVAQNIKTRLQSFLGDCFFALEQGIDWFNLNGGKSIPAITLAVRATILNSYGVAALQEVTVTLDDARHLSIVYGVDTIYGSIVSTEEIDFTPTVDDFILWDNTGFLTLEDTGLIIL